MKDVTIKLREPKEGHPEDAKLYEKLHRLMQVEASALLATGVMDDHQVIACHVRAVQQLAANATAIAASIGIQVEIA